jgi:hypothetical protein
MGCSCATQDAPEPARLIMGELMTSHATRSMRHAFKIRDSAVGAAR